MNLAVLMVSGLGALLAGWRDEVPKDEDVKAGWLAFWVIIALIVVVALLLWSFTRHVRRAREYADAGMFGPTEAGEPIEQAEDSGQLPDQHPREGGP